MHHWADYVIFAGFLLISLGIGLYHALTGGKQRTTEEFIMANRQLKVVPVMLSLVMSYMSAIAIVGSTAELYSYGIEFWPMSIVGFGAAILFAERICVPWLYPLQLTSVNEYFELRYGDKEVRAFASLTGILSAVLYMGVCMLAPSVALETATGFPTKVSILVMAIVCIVYTAMGGMRAVIWTDVFQFIVMTTGLLVIIIKASLDTGLVESFDILRGSNRTNFINFSFDPRVRQTLWSFIFGWGLQWGCVYGLQQAAVQRYSALTSQKDARIALLISFPGIVLVMCLTSLVAVFVFPHFFLEGCDPLVSRQIKNPNELLSLYIRKTFAEVYGFSGLFLATLFSGALSSVSSSLSGCAANAWDDILKAFLPTVSPYRATIINKTLVVVFGLLATAVSIMALMMPGPVTQIAVAFFGACGGPLLGLFFSSGIRCLKWVRSRAVMIGAIGGIGINLWIAIASSFMKKSYELKPPITLEHCDPPVNLTITQSPLEDDNSGIENLYKISYMWYGLFGCIVTMILIMVFSGVTILISPNKKARDIPDQLFIPFGQIFTFKCRDDFTEVATSEKDDDITKCSYPTDEPSPFGNIRETKNTALR